MDWLLPDPDSPTIATVSPGRTSKSTFLTARISPSCVAKVTFKPRMLRIASVLSLISAILRVERVAQAVAQEIQGEQNDSERDRGIDQQPGRALDVGRTVGDQQAEAGQRFLHA